MKVYVYDIEWDVNDSEELNNLPKEFIINIEDGDTILDDIYDKYKVIPLGIQYKVINVDDIEDTKDTFIDDLEKMCDLLEEIMTNKLTVVVSNMVFSYDYLSKDEVLNTIKEINGTSLAYLLRKAENANIEEMNGRPTGLAITSEQAKITIIDYVYNNLLTDEDIEDFDEIRNSMAC